MAMHLPSTNRPPSLPSASPAPFIDPPVQFGFLILVSFLFLFGGWAFFSQLEGAAVAPGKITVDSHRKTIKHLEGGIIRQIYIKEGQQVERGTLLARLDDTRSRASFEAVRTRMDTLYATEARLIAERDGAANIQFPPILTTQLPNPAIHKLIESQVALFQTNRESLEDQKQILDQRIKETEKEIESNRAQARAAEQQLSLINEEIKAVAYLQERQLIEKPRLLALQREAARLTGSRDEELGRVAQLEQRIGEIKSQMIGIQTQRQRDVLQDLRDTQRDLSDAIQQHKSLEDIVKRTDIYSPIDGRIVDLRIHTVGGVVAPGEPLMDIVPLDDKLIIEARINPLDIDEVHPELQARVILSAYKTRHLPQLTGTVSEVSADVFQDTPNTPPYYLARITINNKELAKINFPVKLYPGMPVQVMIVTEKHTPWDYLITPITDSFMRAFKES